MRKAKSPQPFFEETNFKGFSSRLKTLKNFPYFLEQTHEGKYKLIKSGHKSSKKRLIYLLIKITQLDWGNNPKFIKQE